MFEKKTRGMSIPHAFGFFYFIAGTKVMMLIKQACWFYYLKIRGAPLVVLLPQQTPLTRFISMEKEVKPDFYATNCHLLHTQHHTTRKL